MDTTTPKKPLHTLSYMELAERAVADPRHVDCVRFYTTACLPCVETVARATAERAARKAARS